MLKIYSDAACTQEVLPTQSFPGTGAQTSFTLTAFPGASLQSVYYETQVSQSGVTFASGVGSGFSGLTINALIGQRVIHNGTFRGTVVSNTATTVTISDLTYTYATGTTCIISSYAKKVLNTDYTVSGNTIMTMSTTLTSSQNIHCIPVGVLAVPFGGNQGDTKTSALPFWLKRSPLPDGVDKDYNNIQVQCLDLSQTQASLAQASVTFASGVGSGFSGLVAGTLIGRALTHGGTYKGTVTANTTTTVTISDTSYTNATAASATLFTVGSAEFAPDVSGSPGTYVKVLQPSAITTNTAVKFWMDDTIIVPASAMNYPNNVINVYALESISA
jgi:hypothetical protein